jgi:hypothetical protein
MAELSPRDQATLSRISGDMMTLLLLDDAWTEWAGQRPGPSGHRASPRAITDEMVLLLGRMAGAADLISALPERMGDDLSARFDALMWGDWLSSADRDDLRWVVMRAGGVNELARSAAVTLSDYQSEADDLQTKVTQWERAGPRTSGPAEPGRAPVQTSSSPPGSTLRPPFQAPSSPPGSTLRPRVPPSGGAAERMPLTPPSTRRVAPAGRPPESPDEPQGDLSRSYRCGLGTGLLVSGAAALPSAIGTGAAAAFTAGAAGAVAAGVIVGATGGVAAIAIIVAGLMVMRRARC